MSESNAAGSSSALSSQMRTLAVRINDDLRAQLDVIAQLNSRSVTEEIRIALEAWIETSKSDPKVLQRAELVRADIEREAKTRQSQRRSRPLRLVLSCEYGGYCCPLHKHCPPSQQQRHKDFYNSKTSYEVLTFFDI